MFICPRHARVFAAVLLASGFISTAQMPAAKPAIGSVAAPAEVYDRMLTGLEKEFVSAAEAMPEDKYSFAPTTGEFKGVRSFGQQITHVAEANDYYFGDPSKPETDESAAMSKLTTKAEIVKALKDSFVQAHAFLATITAQNAFVVTKRGTRAGNAAFGMAHMMDHYGQLVVYLRLNGIVPPASRGTGM